ncbi:MAG: ribonuclease R, partial [Pseudomonadota bacterium]|nr:ribonuclease R [Pseudomonadota bacterium]
LGIFQMINGRGRILPTSRRVRTGFIVPPGQENGASQGDLVEGQPIGRRSFGLPEARVTEIIGNAEGQSAASLIATHTHDIPIEFEEKAIAAAEAARPIEAKGRVDLRKVPLITIDGADARDFDDAVWAEKTPDGWRLIVAIADVSWYVRAGTPLDREALKRGNSVYFPDKVIPMLPESLSNGLCSLVPNEDRGCIAAQIWIDKDGNLKRHEFVRGIMRSAARFTYEQVEAAWTGSPDDSTAPLLDGVIVPLYGAFDALQGARIRRGTIDLELSEQRVVIGRDGNVAAIEPVKRLDSHRLIEEFMIAANIAAAEALERKDAHCMYRVHDRPSLEKLEGLREALAPLGITITRGQVIKPQNFQRIVSQAAGRPEMETISMAVLRSQAQAEYNQHNIGHFGLALRRYAHFTSPIRRYSDLLVHRSLITAYNLGDGGLTPEDGEKFADIGKHISATERRAIDAEREANDRYKAAYLNEQVGIEFEAKVNGVHRAGLFITLTDTGADGLVPMSMIGDDQYNLDHKKQQIKACGTGKIFSIGTLLKVRLEEANIQTGSLVFSLVTGTSDRRKRSASRKKRRRGQRKSKERIVKLNKSR